LVKDGEIVAAAQEERFTRVKGDWRFPKNAIAYCLALLPENAELSAVAYYEDPAWKADRILRTARRIAPGGATLWPRMLTLLREIETELPSELSALIDPDKVYFVPHHKSHAASAFYPAPLDTSAVLVVDGVGEWSTTTLWNGAGSRLDPIGEINFPHSLGMFYAAFTQYCGFRVNSGEYKLMGLAPFGTPVFRNLILDNLIDLKEDGSFMLNMAYFQFDRGLSTTNPLFEMLFDQPARRPESKIAPFFADIAASAQAVLEEALVRLATTTLRKTGQKDLCLAGGVALNCVANTGLIRRVPGLETLWVQPAAGDAGAAVGAAFALTAQIAPEWCDSTGAKRQPDRMNGAYLGPAYTPNDVQAALDAHGLVFERCDSEADFCAQVASALAQGAIVGHFDGRMEYGPRALGNRSILADPRSRDMQAKVNRRVKFREGWRPFAPMVLQEHAAELFEAPSTSPYMLVVSDLKPKFRGPTSLQQARGSGLFDPGDLINAVTSEFSAVTHVDFSARLQTVSATSRSRARPILEAFFDLTRCPVLLNTSFNVRGEPIVNTPKDAIDCFLNADLDLLAIGPFLVHKAQQSADLQAMVGGKRFATD
jgi:carbamoyltransferase